MAKLSKYQTLQKKLMAQTTKLFDLSDAKELYTALSNGQNSYLRFDRFESTAMDMTWIKQIEDCIPDLNEIVSNPKRTIQTLAEVVEVEKVKRTTHESVQHLASHSQFVKTIDEDGNVTPSKILNVYNDDFFAIYENKFVATLLRRLFLFVEKRYDYIIHQATLKDVELLYFKNKTEINGSEIEIETKIRYSKPALDEADEKLKEMLRRINDIRRYLRFFGGSEFMRILHRERDVRNPILQTNIIRKNPKYRHCYHLWQFINSYNESGVEIKVEENFAKLTEEDLKEINKVLTINFLALKGRDAPVQEAKPKIYRPRILRTYDDEMYNPGASFDSPVEFVRVDEKYRQYKETLKDLNPHPTKSYAEYMKNEYADNKLRREETAQKDSLIKRKENEYKKYEKTQEELLIKEQEDWEMIGDLAEQQIQEEQEERLRPLREKLGIQGDEDETRINDAISTEGRMQEIIEDAPIRKPSQPVEEEPEELDSMPIEVAEEVVSKKEPQKEESQQPAEQPKEEKVKGSWGGARAGAGRKPKPRPEPVEEVQEEQPQPEPEPVVEEKTEEPVKVKGSWGGARPGAGRKRKVVEPVEEAPVEEEPVVETQPEPVQEQEPVKVKGSWGGARPGAGRKRKVVEEQPQETQPEPQPEPVIEEPQPVAEQRVKGSWGGARPGAGRKRKIVAEPEEVKGETPTEPEPINESEPVKVKGSWGGARPGAGRKRKVVEEQPQEAAPIEEKPVEQPQPIEEKVKGSWGGARPGAGRKRKVVEPEPVVEETPVQETPITEEQPVKKQRGGYRPGAGRKPKKPVVHMEAVENTPAEVVIKKQRGGARPGAGRKPKPKTEQPIKGKWGGARPGAGRKPKPKSDVPVVKKQRGGARPGAGRKPKPRPENE